MRILALDTSKSNTGWAFWDDESEKVYSGSFSLGSEFSTLGGVCARLHMKMDELHAVHRFDAVWMEEPMHPSASARSNKLEEWILLMGLIAHVHSYCAARDVRHVGMVHQMTWRKNYFGGQKRGTRSAAYKALANERCKQLGFKPKSSDEAEALGILDYYVSVVKGIMPIWRRDEVLRPPLGKSS